MNIHLEITVMDSSANPWDLILLLVEASCFLLSCLKCRTQNSPFCLAHLLKMWYTDLQNVLLHFSYQTNLDSPAQVFIEPNILAALGWSWTIPVHRFVPLYYGYPISSRKWNSLPTTVGLTLLGALVSQIFASRLVSFVLIMILCGLSSLSAAGGSVL